MRASTAACLVVLAAALTGLTVSVARVSRAPDTGKREYLLAVWGAAQETGELQTRIIDPVNARNEHFQIRLVPIPADYDTKLSTMIAGGTPPDFFYLSQRHVPVFAAQGALLDLTALIHRDRDDVSNLRRYYPSVLAGYQHNGRTYALPWIAQPVILYCNAALFREANVPLPDENWNWQTFVEAGKALTRDTDGDGTIDRWGFILKRGWPPYQVWVWQNGAYFVDRKTARLNLGDSGTLDAFDFLSSLVHVHRIAPPVSTVSEAGFVELFKSGKVAMFMGGAADDVDRIEGLEVVAAELPAGPEGVRATFAWTAGLCISAEARDPERAFEAYKQILDGIQRWKIPAPRRRLAAKLEQFEPRKSAAAEVIRRSMEYMRAPVVREDQVRWDTLFGEEFEDELLRKGTPARELYMRKGPILERMR